MAFDSVAGNVHYHKSCRTILFNQAKARVSSSTFCKQTGESELTYDPLVIAELVAYIQHQNCAVKLNDIRDLYIKRLIEIKSDWLESNVNATRFKDHLIGKLGNEWQCFNQSKYVILSPKHNTAEVLMNTLKSLTDTECKKIMDVGLLLRNHILNTQPSFTGYFSENSLRDPVPSPLLTLIRVLLEGPTFLDTSDDGNQSAREKVALCLSQLIISNSVKRGKKRTKELHQAERRETPLALYLGFKLDSCGRQKKLVKQFHKYGLCVSYDRVKKLKKKIARGLSRRYKEDEVVVPTNCVKGIFYTGTTDNIDESGRVEMHGTSITLIGHRTHENCGECRPKLNIDVDDGEPIMLPEDFATVPFVEDCGGDVKLETIPARTVRPVHKDQPHAEDNYWLNHA